MPTVQKANFFSRTIAHPGGAVTLAALLRIGGWGLQRNSSGVSTTDKSADSFVGDNVQFIPTTDMFVGDDQFVSNAAGAGVYQGVLATGGSPFNVTDYCRGPVLADDIFIFSLAGQNMQLIFQPV